MSEAPLSGYKRILFPALLILLCLLVLGAVYGATVVFRGLGLYEDVKWSGRGFIGEVYRPDPDIGYVPAPGAYGANAIPLGEPVPLHHDDDGLPAPLGVKRAFKGDRHPRLLFLGCSFTYGQMVAAEHAYPYRTALKVGGEAINGGVPGYGLPQMLLRARRLVPKFKPDYVVVQYSPWLVERAVTEFAPTRNQLVAPVPYYSGDESPAIVGAAFAPLKLSLDHYRRSPPGLGDKLAFLWEVARPMYVHDDIHVRTFRLKQWLGLADTPSRNMEAVIKVAYADFDELARQNGAQLVIMVLGSPAPLYIPESLFPPGTIVVNGQQALLDRLQVRDNEDYIRHYWHWRGNPPQPVDEHPNEKAHEILAEALANRLRELPATTR